ncbi:DUF309 domain-containing protein [Anaeromyxobacter oryzae]|uniref:DUF309 domain-containing protein n=1 Tax=Anaeromyxobacter oryzae TaxID=2918170 RepID=A0ABN6MNG1_9BACT|nr:DUF309 domain-containing protein [Anaeromyxobacter oryzae]BDG01229.1 hypothetical protein AMOR_02250 [Anaeromyxobacter oryzae]
MTTRRRAGYIPGVGKPSAAPSAATLQALAEGCRRFDEARWFEAHEVWEDAWRGEAGRVRLLLQGLIQIAAGFHKGLVHGRPAGMVKLLGAGLAKLEAAGDLGLVDLTRLRPAVQAWLEAARRWDAGGPRPALPPPRLGAAT